MNRGVLLVAVFSLVLIFSFTGEPADGDAGTTIHSMTVFVDSSASSGYDYMVWDFGDGTVLDTRDTGDPNPSHTYAETGTYGIVLTVYRYAEEELLSDSSVQTVNVMGPPTVELVSEGEEFASVTVKDRTGREYNPAEEPDGEPEREGMDFAGWVTSDGKPYDWGLPVSAPLTLYASWEESEEPEGGELEEAGSGPEELPDGSLPEPWDGAGIPAVTAAALVVGVLALTAYMRRS